MHSNRQALAQRTPYALRKVFSSFSLAVISILLIAATLFTSANAHAQNATTRTITDGIGRTVIIPTSIERVICSGSGCLRLLTYMQQQDMIVGVDALEVKKRTFEARPYAIANPQFKTYPVFGEHRGYDHPERILALESQPQVIFKTFTSAMGLDADELESKTGIPVIVLPYGNLGAERDTFYASLRLMGNVLGTSKRAEELIAFFETTIHDLQQRTENIPQADRPTVFIGGVAFNGAHGFQATEPSYPPFSFINAKHVADTKTNNGVPLRHSYVTKEQILAWNPHYLFVDLSTMQLGAQADAIHELRTDPTYQALDAVQQGHVYGLLPYNWYAQNFGSILVNAYAIGKLIYPEQFKDISIEQKAKDIYTTLLGECVLERLNKFFDNQAFTHIKVQ